jgi:hypothetical protein
MSTLNARDAQTRQQTAGKPDRPDPYQQVTDLIIGHLETGVVPWRCPWNREVGRPRNFHTGKAYRGVNVILLGCRFAASPWWMTYRQARKEAMGGAWGGVLGDRFWHLLRGEEVPDQETSRKSIDHSHVLPPDCRPPDKAWPILCKLLHKACERLRAAGLLTGALTVQLAYLGRPGGPPTPG